MTSDYTLNAEDRYLREHMTDTYACRQLAEWALAHFGDRTDPMAYQRLIISLANTGTDLVVEKIHKDLNALSYAYREEAVMRMYERFRREAEKRAWPMDELAA